MTIYLLKELQKQLDLIQNPFLIRFLRNTQKLHHRNIEIKGENEDEQTGIEIIKRVLEEPLRQIAENAGFEGSVVTNKVFEGEGDYGFNAQTEKYENFFKTGVIDPTKVARIALENAASVAGMFLTTECVVSEIKEDKPMPMPSPGGGMNGMY